MLFVAVAVLYFLHFRQLLPRPWPPRPPPPKPRPLPPPPRPTPPPPWPPAEQPVTPPTVPAAEAANADQIAYIESAKLLDGYQGMKDACRSFEVKAKGWERCEPGAGHQLPHRRGGLPEAGPQPHA
ncbi:MAG: hypothetical protein WKG07_27860 [Hymenobacter sp.]